MEMGHEDIEEEYIDVLTETGEHTGIAKPRWQVHKQGDYHRAVNVWIYAEDTGELLLQKRADSKDSWPGLWDVSSAGHISAGDTSVMSAMRELQEELGVTLPSEAFELLFVCLQQNILNDGSFINNEYNDVYLVTTVARIPLDAFTLQESEVSMVKYIGWKSYEVSLKTGDPAFVPYDVDGQYGQLFSAIRQRYETNYMNREVSLRRKLSRYVEVEVGAELTGVNEGDLKALAYTIQAAELIDRIFLQQVWSTIPSLKLWLEQHQADSEFDRLKLSYFSINKSPWSCLDENEAYLTTADSAIHVATGAMQPVSGWEGLQYRATFPVQKPLTCNFYPSDMTRREFELWKEVLSKEEQDAATGFFTVIRRTRQEMFGNAFLHPAKQGPIEGLPLKPEHLQIIPYSKEYSMLIMSAAEYLRKAGDAAHTPSLRKFLKSKAKSFLSDDYYDSDVAWINLDSPIDITIGPYETYEDGLFGYKATFEAFIGIRDEIATSQLKLFSDYLQVLEDNLPIDSRYKSKNVTASPIRAIHLIYNAGDVKGPQTVAFNLPNDEKIVKEHGSAMVMLKNISEAKFVCILKPIAMICISKEQQDGVDFESFFTHTICHECCHGIGPHTITLPDGKESTVRLELQELHSSIEEAKADIVGLWALHYLLDRGLLPRQLERTMYISFLAGCFRSIRFGLEEAHGKGQALQFNWILERGGFVCHANGSFSVDFSKVRNAVESLSREIMTIQAQGDKNAAKRLLDKFAKLTPPLQKALSLLEDIAVPVDISPVFTIKKQLASLFD